MSAVVIKFHMSRSYNTSWCGLDLVLLSATGVDVGIAGRPDAATCIGCLGEAARAGNGAARARLVQLSKAPSSPGLITRETDSPPPGFEQFAACPRCESRDVVLCLGLSAMGDGPAACSAYFMCEACGFFAKHEITKVVS